MDDSAIQGELAASESQLSLASRDGSLKGALEGVIVSGVERGLVTVDEATGLPVAKAVTPAPGLVAASASWAEHQAWIAHPYFEEAKAVKDLEYALKCPTGPEVALRALGVPLVHSGAYELMLASWLVRDLAPIADGAAPASVLKRMTQILAAYAEALEGERIWQSALKNAFLMVNAVGADQRPRTRVEFILEMLRASTSDLPPRFLAPTEAHLAKADRVMRHLRAKRTGRRKGNWAAAREFAKAFGVPMPLRERDARRRKTARLQSA